MTQCTFQKQHAPRTCDPPQHLIAANCPRCGWNNTLLLCTTHWNLYQWTLTEDLGANCPACWNPIQAARTDITGQEEISYYGEK